MWKLFTVLFMIVSLTSGEDVRLVDLDPPEAQQLIDSKDTSLKYAPKIDSNVPAVRYIGNEPQNVVEDIYLANQYHGQDGLGGYLYGYSVPDIAKTERKKAGGDLRGAYNYIAGNGQEIKVEYWDDGNGFHQVDNVPKILPKQIDDLPAVKAAKDEHARRWAEEAERNSKPIQNPYPSNQPGAYAGLGAGVGAGVPNPKPQGQFNAQSGQNFGGYQGKSQQQGFGQQQHQQGGYQGSQGFGGQQGGQKNYGSQGSGFGGQQQGAQGSGFGGQHQGSQGSGFGGQHQGSQGSGFGGQQGSQGQQHFGGQGQGQGQGQGFGSQHGQQGQQHFGGQGQGQGFGGQSQGQQGQQHFGGQGQGQQHFGASSQSQGQGFSGQQPGLVHGQQNQGQNYNKGPQGSQGPQGPQGSYGQSQGNNAHTYGQGPFIQKPRGNAGGYNAQASSQNQFGQQGQHGQQGQQGQYGQHGQNDYSGQQSQTQNKYASSPNQQQQQQNQDDGDDGSWKDDTNQEEQGPPKGFFYNFDYPVGIIVSKQGGAQPGGSLSDTYSKNKANFEQQLQGGAAVHGAGSYPSYQVHS